MLILRLYCLELVLGAYLKINSVISYSILVYCIWIPKRSNKAIVSFYNEKDSQRNLRQIKQTKLSFHVWKLVWLEDVFIVIIKSDKNHWNVLVQEVVKSIYFYHPYMMWFLDVFIMKMSSDYWYLFMCVYVLCNNCCQKFPTLQCHFWLKLGNMTLKNLSLHRMTFHYLS